MRAADEAREKGQLGEAAALYGRLAERFADNAGLMVLRGNMLKDARRYAEARESYEAAITRDASNADVHLQLGHLAKLEGDFEKAALSYRQSALLDPHRPDARDELRALDPLVINSLTVQREDHDQTPFVCGGPNHLLFERLKVAFAHKPA